MRTPSKACHVSLQFLGCLTWQRFSPFFKPMTMLTLSAHSGTASQFRQPLSQAQTRRCCQHYDGGWGRQWGAGNEHVFNLEASVQTIWYQSIRAMFPLVFSLLHIVCLSLFFCARFISFFVVSSPGPFFSLSIISLLLPECHHRISVFVLTVCVWSLATFIIAIL